MTLCVHPDFQRSGHGKRILYFLLERAHRLEVKICFLEVRSSNMEARSLYKSMGFLPISERKNYYPLEQGHEDAIIMLLRLPN